ncbi:putative acetyltransferase protein [Phaeoacremonium minimum UCRPA7]|uniref:Putative acetyltransferase protein n=1 Tax=Phaeoacremonium minimum (strain UCR-PA7) TaxID=1286976 RepID=R8BUX1_PHAM7|nr:putative acetyltransferase protein [Phaeoacremonium minimum UCRPA7]EOO03171.1 putative acetyltransferase protein [Phaeoacremonium minimum UCRPA7]
MADSVRSSAEGVSIVRAKVENAPAIKSMVVAAYSKYIERIGKPPAPMLTDYAEVINTEDVFVLQTNDNKTVVGSIVLDLHGAADSIKINNLVVDPTAQGRGYGRVLMKYAEDVARAQGAKAITLYTNVKMFENLILYPKMGFKETERKIDAGYERVYFRKGLE